MWTMVGNFPPITRGLVWTFLVQKYGLSKDQANAAITLLEGDSTTMLLLPLAGSQNSDIWQFSHAAYRKYKGMSPIILDLTVILGALGL